MFELRLLADTFSGQSKQFQDSENAAARLRIILKHVGLSSEGDLLSLCDRLANEAYHAHFRSYEDLRWIPRLIRDEEVNAEMDDVAATTLNAKCDTASAPNPTSSTGSSDNDGCGTKSGGASSTVPAVPSATSLTGSSCINARRNSGKESGANAAPGRSASVPDTPRVSCATSLTVLSVNNCARDTGVDNNTAPRSDDSGSLPVASNATSTSAPATAGHGAPLDANNTTDTTNNGSNAAPLATNNTTDSTDDIQNTDDDTDYPLNMDADSTTDSTDDFQNIADDDTSMDVANTTDAEDSPKADEKAHHGPFNDSTSLESKDSSNSMGVAPNLGAGSNLVVSKTIDTAPAPTIEAAHTGNDTGGNNVSAGSNAENYPHIASGAYPSGNKGDAPFEVAFDGEQCQLHSPPSSTVSVDDTKDLKPAFQGASDGLQSHFCDSPSSTARVCSKPSDNDDDSEYKGIYGLLGLQSSETDEKDYLLLRNESDTAEAVSCSAFNALSRAVSVHEMVRMESSQAQKYLRLLKCEKQCKRLGPSYRLEFDPAGVLTPFWFSPTKEWSDAHVWLFTILLEILHRTYSNVDLVSIGKHTGNWKCFDSQYMYLMPFMKLGFVPPVFVRFSGAKIDEELEEYLSTSGNFELLLSSVPQIDFDATLKSIFSSLEHWLAPCFLTGMHQNLMNATRLFDPDYMCYRNYRKAEIERVKTTIDAMMYYRSPEEKEAANLILEKFQASSTYFLNQVALCRRILHVKGELGRYHQSKNVIDDDSDDDVAMKDDSRAIDKQCMEGHDSAGDNQTSMTVAGDNQTSMTVGGAARAQGIGDNFSDAAIIDSNVAPKPQSNDDGCNSNRGAESSLISESDVENHDDGGNRDNIINVAPKANKDSDDNDKVDRRTRETNTSTTAIVDSTEASKDNDINDDDIDDAGDDFCSTTAAISANIVSKNASGPSFVGQQAQPSSEQESMASFEDKTPTTTTITCAESLKALSDKCAKPQAMSPFRRVKEFLQMGAMDMASKFCAENSHSLNDTQRNELLALLCENGHDSIIEEAFPSLRRRGQRKRKEKEHYADHQDDLPLRPRKRKKKGKRAGSR